MSGNDLERDKLLDMFVDLAKNKIECPVILNVKGITISGIIISGQKYFEELINQIQNGTGNANKLIADSFNSALEKVKQEKINNNDDNKKAKFIYLKNANLLIQNDIIDIKLWRGRIDSIDGFSLGLTEKPLFGDDLDYS